MADSLTKTALGSTVVQEKKQLCATRGVQSSGRRPLISRLHRFLDFFGNGESSAAAAPAEATDHEQLQHERVQADFPVIACVVEEQDIAILRGEWCTLSEGGISAIFKAPLVPHTPFLLELYLPGFPEKLSLEGVVLHSTDDRHGIHFGTMSQKSRTVLRKVIANTKSPMERLLGIRWQRPSKPLCPFCQSPMMRVGPAAFLCRLCLHWEHVIDPRFPSRRRESLARCRCRQCHQRHRSS